MTYILIASSVFGSSNKNSAFVKKIRTMEGLNYFAKSWLFVDLENRQYIKNWLSPFPLINQVILFISIFRFAFFAIAERSDYQNFAFGWRLYFVASTRIWALVMCLGSMLYFLSNLVTCLSWWNPNYYSIIRKPVLDTIAKDRATVSRLAFFANVFAVCGFLCPFLLDSTLVLLLSFQTQMTALEYVYCLFWTYQYGVMGGCSATSVTTGIFLFPTCKSLLKSFSQVKVKLLWSRNLTRAPYITNVLKMFNKACRDVKWYDGHWKKALFVNVTISTLLIGLVAFLVVLEKLYLALKIVIIVCLVQVVFVISYMILAPASVNAAARGLYKRFCSIAANKYLRVGIGLRIKLGYAIKRFTNPIALSLWDTNYLGYMNYFQFVVGIASNFFLAANLMMQKS